MEQFPGIDRAALIVTPKKPFIDWLVYNSKKYDSSENEFKQEDLKTEGFDSKKVYLIPSYDKIEKYEKFVRRNFAEIFEHELFDWYTEPAMWPEKRTWKIFNEWFDYEIQTMVFDTASNKPIEYEGDI